MLVMGAGWGGAWQGVKDAVVLFQELSQDEHQAGKTPISFSFY